MGDKKRTPNFMDEDIKILIQIVKKYSNVIECKKSDTVTWKEKMKCWDQITTEFNNVTGITRSTNSVKQKYKNVKKETRKKFAVQKCETLKTGGGTPSVVKISSVDEEIKEMLGCSVTGLDNPFDSDECITFIIDDNPDNEIESTEPLINQSEVHDTNVLTNNILNDNTEDEKIYQEKNQGDVIKEKEKVIGEDNWEKWNPSMLKAPISKSLRAPAKMKKSELTKDCRFKINTLSMAKIELIELQKYILKRDMAIKEKELEMKEEEHGIRMEKHKLEMIFLKKKLETSFI